MKKIIATIVATVLMFVTVTNVQLNVLNAQDIQTELATNVTQGIGYPISENFPDPIFAQAVANKVSSGDINAILTQSMVEGLTSLSVTFKNIQDISGVEYLTSLQTLMVYDNKLTALPENIGNLTNLITLHIYNNQITSLPDSIGNLVNLQVFHASNNKLTALPDSFGNMTNLETIYLVNNQLVTLPDSFGNLVNLDTARITQNKLITLPESIGQLSNLRELRLYQNEIATLPESIGGLIKLSLLDLGENQLSSLPNTLGNLSNLNTAYLDNNLLPNNYNDVLNTLGLSMIFSYEAQRQLTLTAAISPYVIKNGMDLNEINLNDLTYLNDNANVSSGHTLIMENFIDEDGNSVDLTDYIENQIVIKNGTIRPQIRAVGTGLFPNTSEHAITVDRLILVFETTYYELTFDLNGAEGTPPEMQILLENQVGKIVDEPIRDGYRFIGWNTQADGSGDYWELSSKPMPPNNVTLYAQWSVNSYDLSFDINGGDTIAPPTQTLDFDALATEVTEPTKLGYTFIGWNTAIDGSGATWDFATSTMPAADTTLYAQWSVNSYDLSFNINGGDTIAPPTQTLDFDALAREVTEPTKLGYTFTGWNTAIDGSGATWDFATSTMPAADTTLYAQWSVNSYDLSFDINGGDTIAPPTQTLDFDALATEVIEPKKLGYTFTGWNTAIDGSGVTWDFATSTMPAANTTLYAQWSLEEVMPPTSEETTKVQEPTPELLVTGQSTYMTLISMLLLGVGAMLISLRKKLQ